MLYEMGTGGQRWEDFSLTVLLNFEPNEFITFKN